MDKIEIEKKYRVEMLPVIWDNPWSINYDEIINITQTYLVVPDGSNWTSHRIRSQKSNIWNSPRQFFENKKLFLGPGKNVENETEILEHQYLELLLSNTDPSKNSILKSRHIFEYLGQKFELDEFDSFLRGLFILEIELDDENRAINLPPYFAKILDVTDDKRYSNVNLANLNSIDSLTW